MAKEEFGCNVACEGIYVDIAWEEENLNETMSGAERTRNNVQRKGDILDGKNFAKMINEYAAHRKRYVQHFRYDPKAGSTNFSKYSVHFAICINQ